MASITQQALRILEEEKQAALVEEQKRIASAKAEAAAKEQAERSVRVQLQAERELARIAAERALAAEEAAAVQAAEAAALQAELARLRARSEIEVLRDEMAQIRVEMAALESSKEEHSAARNEITELKALVHALIFNAQVGHSAILDDPEVLGAALLEGKKCLKNYVIKHLVDADKTISDYVLRVISR